MPQLFFNAKERGFASLFRSTNLLCTSCMATQYDPAKGFQKGFCDWINKSQSRLMLQMIQNTNTARSYGIHFESLYSLVCSALFDLWLRTKCPIKVFIIYCCDKSAFLVVLCYMFHRLSKRHQSVKNTPLRETEDM